MPSWPVGVPQYALSGSFREQPERNVKEFAPEVGDPITRPRSSMSQDIISFNTKMTYEAWDDLKEFYIDDCSQGVLSFTRKHPYDLSGSDITCKFLDAPILSDESYLDVIVSISLRRIA